MCRTARTVPNVRLGPLALLSALAACAVGGCEIPGRTGETPLVVGAILPLSGSDASFGEQVLSGMELRAAAERRLRLEIIPTDGAGEPIVSAHRLEALVADSRVTALVGGWRASAARLLAALAAARRTPFLTLSPLAPPGGREATGIHGLHRIESLAVGAAVWARESRGASAAGVFRDDASEASWRLADAFTREFTARGGAVAWTVGLDDEGRLERPAGPEEPLEVVFVAGSAAVAAEMARFGPATARAAFLLVEGWGGGTPGEDGPESYEVAFHWLDEEREPVSAFVAACAEAGLEPSAARGDGWDAVGALIQAALDGGLTRDGVDRSLRTGEPIEGVGGTLALRGAAETPAVFRIAPGDAEPVGRFEARFVATNAPAVP